MKEGLRRDRYAEENGGVIVSSNKRGRGTSLIILKAKLQSLTRIRDVSEHPLSSSQWMWYELRGKADRNKNKSALRLVLQKI